ncbi:MAG: hypothetical protein HAW59_05700, partial [Betaproteobacteria bacterium]|nr:hypothetical protein [Betaproteobacteria bacterium]
MKNGVIKKENSGNVRKICFSRAAANIGLFFALIAAAFSAAAQTPCTGSDREIDTDTGICVCIGQDRTMENEQCVCPSGTEEIPGSQNCATECTGEFSRQTGGACGCPAGQIPQTTEDNNLCVCPAGGKIKQGDSCVCPSGMEEYPASSNTCVAVCTDDFSRQTGGACGCPAGQIPQTTEDNNLCVCPAGGKIKQGDSC